MSPCLFGRERILKASYLIYATPHTCKTTIFDTIDTALTSYTKISQENMTCKHTLREPVTMHTDALIIFHRVINKSCFMLTSSTAHFFP